MDNHIQTLQPDPYQVEPEGKRVPQYGPEWVKHVTEGGDVCGNILIGVSG